MVKKKTEFEIMQQDITVVKTKLEEHCKTQKEDFDRIYYSLEKLNNKFDNLDNRYATKQELQQQAEQIKSLKDWKKTILPGVSTVLTLILATIAFIKFVVFK